MVDDHDLSDAFSFEHVMKPLSIRPSWSLCMNTTENRLAISESDNIFDFTGCGFIERFNFKHPCFKSVNSYET